jgi:cytochrome c-type biogenesis protein CcmE
MVTTRTKLIIALIIVACILGMLIRTAVTRASTYYVTVKELYQQGSTAVGNEATISGNIVGASVQWDPQKPMLQFKMQDDPQGQALNVQFTGTKPDDFSNDWPVIVTGKLVQPGHFVATKLLIKCPSKYESNTTQTFTAQSAT